MKMHPTIASAVARAHEQAGSNVVHASRNAAAVAVTAAITAAAPTFFGVVIPPSVAAILILGLPIGGLLGLAAFHHGGQADVASDKLADIITQALPGLDKSDVEALVQRLALAEHAKPALSLGLVLSSIEQRLQACPWETPKDVIRRLPVRDWCRAAAENQRRQPDLTPRPSLIAVAIDLALQFIPQFAYRAGTVNRNQTLEEGRQDPIVIINQKAAKAERRAEFNADQQAYWEKYDPELGARRKGKEVPPPVVSAGVTSALLPSTQAGPQRSTSVITAVLANALMHHRNLAAAGLIAGALLSGSLLASYRLWADPVQAKDPGELDQALNAALDAPMPGHTGETLYEAIETALEDKPARTRREASTADVLDQPTPAFIAKVEGVLHRRAPGTDVTFGALLRETSQLPDIDDTTLVQETSKLLLRHKRAENQLPPPAITDIILSLMDRNATVEEKLSVAAMQSSQRSIAKLLLSQPEAQAVAQGILQEKLSTLLPGVGERLDPTDIHIHYKAVDNSEAGKPKVVNNNVTLKTLFQSINDGQPVPMFPRDTRISHEGVNSTVNATQIATLLDNLKSILDMGTQPSLQEAFKKKHSEFWANRHHGGGLALRTDDLLARERQANFIAEVKLRKLDGTLDNNAADLAAVVYMHASAAERTRFRAGANDVKVARLSIKHNGAKGVAVRGAFAIIGKTSNDPLLVSLPGKALEAFKSMEELSQAFVNRVKNPERFTEITNLFDPQSIELNNEGFFRLKTADKAVALSFKPLKSNVFSWQVKEIAALQQRRVDHVQPPALLVANAGQNNATLAANNGSLHLPESNNRGLFFDLLNAVADIRPLLDLSISLGERNRLKVQPESGGAVGVDRVVSQSTKPLLSIEDPRALDDEVVRIAKKMKNLYHPIMSPADFIRKEIIDCINEFDRGKKVVSSLNPDSKINVTFIRYFTRSPMVTDNNRDRVLSFSLLEVVTGLHVYKAANLFYDGYLPYYMDRAELMQQLQGINLQSKMERALAEYKRDHDAVSQLKEYYADMINLRCLEYLSGSNLRAENVKAVTQFRSGELQAKEVEFHGTKLNGVFFINSGRSTGLLFSVDDPKFFQVDIKEHEYRDVGVRKVLNLFDFPKTDEFKSWVLAKIPHYQQQEIAERSNAFDHEYVPQEYGIGFGFLNENKVIASPFKFKAVEGGANLVDKLFDGFMNRLDSDIDTLVYTRGERITDRTLEAFKSILNLVSIGTSFAIPGTGAVLLKLFYAAISLATAGGAAGVSVLQAHLSERPETTKYFMREAIHAALMTGMYGVPLGASMGKMVLREAYSLRNMAQTLELYKRVKSAVSSRLSNYVPLKSDIGQIAPPRAHLTDIVALRSLNRLMASRSTLAGGYRPLVDAAEDALHEIPNAAEGASGSRYQPSVSGSRGVELRNDYTDAGAIRRNRFANRWLLKVGSDVDYKKIIENHIVEDIGAAFQLHTIDGDRATTMVVNAHGHFTSKSGRVMLPRDITVEFPAPHRKRLVESSGDMPLMEMLAGPASNDKHVKLYSRLMHSGSGSGSGFTEAKFSHFTEGAAGTIEKNKIMNYAVSHYEKSPDSEVMAAVVANRHNWISPLAEADKFKFPEKMDVLTVKELAGKSKTVRDILKEMSPGGYLSNYKTVRFDICREEKIPITFLSVDKGGEFDYYINFADTPPNMQFNNVREKRSFSSNTFAPYDGYFQNEQVTFSRNGTGWDVSSVLLSITPYRRL